MQLEPPPIHHDVELLLPVRDAERVAQQIPPGIERPRHVIEAARQALAGSSLEALGRIRSEESANPLWISVAMNDNHSCSRYRSKLPVRVVRRD